MVDVPPTLNSALTKYKVKSMQSEYSPQLKLRHLILIVEDFDLEAEIDNVLESNPELEIKHDQKVLILSVNADMELVATDEFDLPDENRSSEKVFVSTRDGKIEIYFVAIEVDNKMENKKLKALERWKQSPEYDVKMSSIKSKTSEKQMKVVKVVRWRWYKQFISSTQF